MTEPLGYDPDGTTDVAHPEAERVEAMTEDDVSHTERVNVGFSSPGSVWVEVEDPTDVEEVSEAFVERINSMNDEELIEMLSTEGERLVENLHYVDSEDSEVYHQW